jgi:hypothetical protein
MTDYDILPDDAPDDLQDRGAMALADAPPTFTGLLTDYANRPPQAESSLALLMDEQQMRDAGVHPEQVGGPDGYSVIDASGAGEQADPAGGVAKAIGLSRTMTKGAHDTASWLGKAPTLAKGIEEGAAILRQAPNRAGAKAAGKAIRAAADEAASHPVIAGLNTLTRASLPPLYAAESLARGANEARDRPLDLEALMGNAIRGTVVTGTSIVSPALAGVANGFLPDGKTMGHIYGKSLVDTDGRALLLP